ncbi:MAG: transposase [Sphingobacteriaceae bacterium]|nr:transposase [Sphingobacteriaceae bacterium]
MGIKNKINEGCIYFLTLTVVDWVDIFTRPVYKRIIIESIKYCQDVKGLEVYVWCLMSNHIHLIAGVKEDSKCNLSDVLRDFKKFTNKRIIAEIESCTESRRKWMLNQFEFAGRYNPKIKDFKFWQDGNEAKEIISPEFLHQKMDYIHMNPVIAEIVSEPHHYLHSSAIDYSGGKGLIDVVFV